MWKRIEDFLQSWPTFTNRRTEITGKGVIMGAVFSAAANGIVAHSATFEHAESVAEFITFCKRLKVIDTSFILASIQLLRRASADTHTDANHTDSILFSCGDFRGGLLKIEDKCDDNGRSPLRF